MRQWIGIFFILGVISTLTPPHARAFDLPSLQNYPSVDVEDEQKLGRTFLRKLRADTPALQDPLLQAYLEDLGYRIAFNGGLSAPDLQIILIPDRQINAFAVPGGVMGVNAGLFMYADNESELAAVLAHEVAHITQRHYARSEEAQKNTTWLYLGALLASLAIATHSSGDAGMALGASAQAAMIQQQLAYSRMQEREADRIGMQTLVQAGYDPNAMPAFFARMDRETRQVGFIPEFLMTHPITADRIADSSLRARSLATTGITDRLEYPLARVRALSLINPPDESRVASLRQRVRDNPDDIALRLALLLACAGTRHFEEARAAYEVLQTRHEAAIDVAIAGADIELADNRPDKALVLLRNALLTSPDSVPLRLYAANAATQSGKAETALTWLEPLTRERPEDPEVWQLLMEAHQQRKDSVNVLRSRAELKFLTGRGDQALRDLREAARQAKDNYPMQARITARLEQMSQLTQQDKSVH